jgi:hypothetical protein
VTQTWAPNRTHGEASVIAHHEAGHAAAKWGLGLPFAWVTIVPSEGFGGRCRTAPIPPEVATRFLDEPRRLLPRFLAGIVGGKVAQEIATGRPHEWSDWWFSYDVQDIERLAEGFQLGDLWDGRVQEIEAATATFLRSVWPAVEALAAALLERGTIEGEEAGCIMAEALRPLAGEEHPKGDTP